MKLLGSTVSKINEDKNGENVLHLEIVELVLVHCNLVNNDYQQDSRILFTFVLLFTNTIKQCELSIKMRYLIEPRTRRHVKGYGFLSFARNIGTHAAKAAKNMSNKYSQKLVDTAKKSATDAIKTASKRAIQKRLKQLEI